ncbi:hypothetical protein [Bacillus toyonensis]|uniref:hypothetical protein n=1 Tax=Bacillus toyonensis TaxID=155322 RepID=UPI000BF35725|nr:hypothetical protein [Bacillus toyonensis]PGF05017.1 hypothetical protein COM61_00860 [Bacillus toyonensis]
MKKFEYMKVEVTKLTIPNHMELCEKKLNEYGEEGWDFLLIDHGQAIFKREKVKEVKRGLKPTNAGSFILGAFGELGECIFSRQINLKDEKENVDLVLDTFLNYKDSTRVRLHEVMEDVETPTRPVLVVNKVPKAETKYNVRIDRNTGHPVRDMTFKYERIRDLFLAIQSVCEQYEHILIGIEQVNNTEELDFTVDNLTKTDIDLLLDMHDKGELLTYVEEGREFDGQDILIENSLVSTSKGYVRVQKYKY